MDNTRWYFSYTLAERAAALRSSAEADIVSDPDLGRQRLERWKASPAFYDNRVYSEFLASNGIDELDFLFLLGQDAEDLALMCKRPPSCLLDLETNLTAPFPDTSADSDKTAAGSDTPNCLVLILPIIDLYRNKLLEHARALLSQNKRASFDPDAIVGSLISNLLSRLSNLLEKTVVLETNISRVEGRLEGTTPEERWSSFIRLLHRSDVQLNILREYPVLARKCCRMLEQWLEVSKEFLDRLHEDYEDLLDHFSIPRQKICRASGGAGDTHRQGRSVHVLEFEDGTKLLYKPRSLSADCLFQDLIGWLNSQGLNPPLRRLSILDRRDYGWTEYIRHRSCKNDFEIGRFYERMGIYLALFYVTAGSDLHYENVVASGEDPVVVDLEAIFQPQIFESVIDSADKLAREKFEESVRAVGLLPSPYHSAGRSADHSGLGGKANQIQPYDVDSLQDSGTDKVRIGKQAAMSSRTIPGNPLLNNEPVEVCAYRNEIEKGFRSVYRLLLKHRNELTAGILERFDEAQVRVVLRSTSCYFSLLDSAQHPTANRNALDQELIFKDLWRTSPHSAGAMQAIACEINQLLDGDVPYFWTTPRGLDIECGDNTRIESVLGKSGYSVALDRIKLLSEEDLEWQVWLIDASLSTLSVSRSPLLYRQGYPRACRSLLDAAISCGERLLETAITLEDQSSWVCLNFLGGRDLGAEDLQYRIGTIPADFYKGLPGVAFFLAYLYKVSEKTEFRKLSEEAINLALFHLDDFKENQSPGAYRGLGGYVYALMHLASVFRREDLLQTAVLQLGDLADFIESDESIDIISGNAGCIPVLLGLSQLRPESGAKALAKRCGRRLLELSATGTQPGGLCWPSLPVRRGFAHGLSGIAWALSELADATGDSIYLECCRSALVEENGLLSGGHWVDAENSEQIAWCHGIPGIALSRLGIYRKHADPQIGSEALAALSALIESPRNSEHIICHGSTGNLEPILIAASAFPAERNRWLAEAEQGAQAILADLNVFGWRSTLCPHLIEPGLMNGLSGIGYGMLRLLDPAHVPSVLLMEAPL